MKRRVLAFLKDISIRHKFYILFVGVALLLSVFMAISKNLATNAMVKKSANQSYRNVVLISELLEGYFEDAISYVQLLTIDNAFQEGLTAYNIQTCPSEKTKSKALVTHTLQSYIIARPMYAYISVTDREYGEIYSSIQEKPSPERLIEGVLEPDNLPPIRPQYTKLMDYSITHGEKPGIALVKSVINKDKGDRIGVIILYMLEEDIARLYASKGYYDGEITIVDTDDNVLSSSDKGNLFQKATIQESYKEELHADGTYFVKNSQGEDVILSVATMEGGTGWRIVNEILVSEVTRDLSAAINIMVIITISAFLIVLVSSFIISAWVLKPILKLSNVMQRSYLSKSFDLRVDVKSNDEVGRLGKIFNRMMDQIKVLITEKNLQQRFLREYEIRLLQSQINPHFLYNSLETIIMLAQLNEKEKSIDATKNLSSFYRLTLNHGLEDITVEEEIKLTRSYLSIQRYRYIEYLDYSIEIDPAIVSYIMPKLTIQPIVENAIYHGIKPNNGGTIRIRGYQEGDDLVFTIHDDGVGMSQSDIDDLLNKEGSRSIADSFGLPSVNTKLKLSYGQPYGLAIRSEEGQYTEVEIRIPKTATFKKGAMS